MGTWTCTQIGKTDTWNGGNEDGTSYVITFEDDGTGQSQMHNPSGKTVNESFPLTYSFSGSELSVSLDHFREPLTVRGVPAEVENGAAAHVAFEGWPNGEFTSTVKDRTVSGIEWAGALFTCTTEG